MKEGSFCVGIDLKDAFPYIPNNKYDWKILKFNWLDQLYQLDAFQFELKCISWVLTKVLKPVIAFLQTTITILVNIYMDDPLIQSSTQQEVFFKSQQVALFLMALIWTPLQWPSHAPPPSQSDYTLNNICSNVMHSGHITYHDFEIMLGTMEF